MQKYIMEALRDQHKPLVYKEEHEIILLSYKWINGINIFVP